MHARVSTHIEICTRLDGLPLAIELAASQLRVMDAEDLVGRLQDQLAFRGPAPAVSPRQRTLGDMVQWSYGMLSPSAQRTFARLGSVRLLAHAPGRGVGRRRATTRSAEPCSTTSPR